MSSPWDLPDPGIELGSPALQADSLPAELPGKPRKFKQGLAMLRRIECSGYSQVQSHYWSAQEFDLSVSDLGVHPSLGNVVKIYLIQAIKMSSFTSD